MRKCRTPDCHPERKHFAKGLCQRCYARKQYVDNREDRLEFARKQRAEDPEKTRAAVRRCYLKKLGEKWIGNYTTRNYPIPTRPRPDVCECCGQKDNRALCVDHEHETGFFRGWLCNSCNRSIGQLGDSIEGVQRALDYLERAKRNIPLPSLSQGTT